MNATLVLNGDWVGEAGSTIWQLHVDGRRATLVQVNDDAPQTTVRFDCRLSETPFTFSLGEPCEEFIGIALDAQYIVIAGLDEGNDVIFARPGLAELFARDAYNCADLAEAPGRFSLSRWAAI